jgi:hypothetical protein
MQPLLIAFLMLIAAITALFVLRFLGNFQQLQRDRINRTPRVTHIAKIETEAPLIETVATEITEVTNETAETQLSNDNLSNQNENAQILNPTEISPTVEENTENTDIQRKKRLKNWLIGGEIFD